MLRAVPVPRVEANLPSNAIADLRPRRLAHVAVQVQIKTPIANFMVFAWAALTRIWGLPSQIFMSEVKRRIRMGIVLV